MMRKNDSRTQCCSRLLRCYQPAPAWSLPLIVLNVVIHVIGLTLSNERVVRVLSGAMEGRRFMPTFAVAHGRHRPVSYRTARN